MCCLKIVTADAVYSTSVQFHPACMLFLLTAVLLGHPQPAILEYVSAGSDACFAYWSMMPINMDV